MGKRSVAADYVHDGGNGRWYVAQYVASANQYHWPLPQAVARASGCSGGFSGSFKGSAWQYKTRAAAMAAARRLYGDHIAVSK